jgi:hypothetical protein
MASIGLGIATPTRIKPQFRLLTPSSANAAGIAVATTRSAPQVLRKLFILNHRL